MPLIARKLFTVRGIVQGVGYRYFALVMARHHGIGGFAKNMTSGEVEVMAEGSSVALTEFRRELERGPAGSRVDTVTDSEPTDESDFSGFNIL